MNRLIKLAPGRILGSAYLCITLAQMQKFYVTIPLAIRGVVHVEEGLLQAVIPCYLEMVGHLPEMAV